MIPKRAPGARLPQRRRRPLLAPLPVPIGDINVDDSRSAERDVLYGALAALVGAGLPMLEKVSGDLPHARPSAAARPRALAVGRNPERLWIYRSEIVR
jgi:hypothetical protein